jgi:hypothetical protein
MQGFQPAPNGMIAQRISAAFALAFLKGILTIVLTFILALPTVCLAQNQVDEPELASSPNLREDVRSTPRTQIRANTKRAAALPVVLQEESPAPTPILEPELPEWRVTCQKILTPFGINTTLIKLGMSGPSVDILGCIILLAISGFILFISFILFQVIRYQVTERMHRQQAAAAKIEPRIPSRLQKNEVDSASSNSNSDTKTSNNRLDEAHAPNTQTRSGVNSRLSINTRNGPDSRLSINTRNGPDSHLSINTRNGPDSRLSIDTRNAPLSQFGIEIPGMNQMLNKNSIQNSPPEFDQARFLRKARVYFLRLQLAWDKSDLNSIRQFASESIFNELREQIVERGETINSTDVLSIQTELLGIELIGGNYIATVKFNGMIKETTELAEAPFEEIWCFAQPAETQDEWILSAIAQSLTT